MMNQARLLIVPTLRTEQDRVARVWGVFGSVAIQGQNLALRPPQRTQWAQDLLTAESEDTAKWVFALEEHAALVPETAHCRRQLVQRSSKLRVEARTLAAALQNPTTVIDQAFLNSVQETSGHCTDQVALIEDLLLHIHNRTFGAVTGYEEGPRQPSDNTVPRLRLTEQGALVVDVPDDKARLRLLNAGWLPPT